VVIAIASSVIPLGLMMPASASTVSVGSILQSTKTAIARQTSAHVLFVGKSAPSGTSEKIIADVGKASGQETLFEGTADLTIRVTTSMAYVSGNQAGLISLFGLSQTGAKELGTHWETWEAGTSQYSDLKGDVTLGSITTLLPKATGTVLSAQGAKGDKRYVLKWTTEASGSIPKLSNTLTISAQNPMLPVEAVATAKGGTRIATTFSKWGEVVHVSAPQRSSTIASSNIKS
jgi:hypothetical protein